MFKKIIDGFHNRLTLAKEIRRQISLIRPDRVAAAIDLKACFIDAASERIYGINGDGAPGYGTMGRSFADYEDDFDSAMDFMDFTGQSLQRLPISLAATKTRENYDTLVRATKDFNREHADELKTRKEYLEKQFTTLNKLMQTNGLAVHFDCDAYMPQMSSDLRVLYMGDFMDIINEGIGFEKSVMPLAMTGGGEEMLQTVKDLRNVPDYSDHYPPRPPRNGKRDRPDLLDGAPALFPLQLRPGNA